MQIGKQLVLSAVISLAAANHFLHSHTQSHIHMQVQSFLLDALQDPGRLKNIACDFTSLFTLVYFHVFSLVSPDQLQ